MSHPSLSPPRKPSSARKIKFRNKTPLSNEQNTQTHIDDLSEGLHVLLTPEGLVFEGEEAQVHEAADAVHRDVLVTREQQVHPELRAHHRAPVVCLRARVVYTCV